MYSYIQLVPFLTLVFGYGITCRRFCPQGLKVSSERVWSAVALLARSFWDACQATSCLENDGALFCVDVWAFAVLVIGCVEDQHHTRRRSCPQCQG